jgi:hypothetical protein
VRLLANAPSSQRGTRATNKNKRPERELELRPHEKNMLDSYLLRLTRKAVGLTTDHVAASPAELERWLSREAGTKQTVHIPTDNTDLLADLKCGLSEVRKASRKSKSG